MLSPKFRMITNLSKKFRIMVWIWTRIFDMIKSRKPDLDTVYAVCMTRTVGQSYLKNDSRSINPDKELSSPIKAAICVLHDAGNLTSYAI